MKIGIIIHSHTGNTLSVAEKLRTAIVAKGHIVQLEKVTAINEDPKVKEKVRLQSIPDLTPYDVIIMGAPVNGFSLSSVMKAYLAQIPLIQGKKVACFVTEYFPKPWMGGNHSIHQMIRSVEDKGGEVIDKGIINWSNKAREEQIKEMVVRLSMI